MGESIAPLGHKNAPRIAAAAHRFSAAEAIFPGIKAFFFVHYWKIIIFIGVLILLLETIEHLPSVTNKKPFYYGEVFLIGLLLLITGFLIKELVRTLAERTEALNTLRLKKDISQQLAAGYDMKSVSEQLVQDVAEILPGAGIELYLYGDPKNRLCRTAFANIEPSKDPVNLLAYDSDPCRACFLKNHSPRFSVSSCSGVNCPVFSGEAQDFCLQLSHGSWFLGILHLVMPAGERLPDAQIKLLENVANDISSALGIAVRKIERDELSLAQKVNSVQLEIARDLHDTIGQNISYLRMKLERMAETRLDRDIAPEIQHMSSVANESYDLVRGTLAMLQPNRSSHLHELFIGHAQQIMERTSLEIGIDCYGDPKEITTRQMRQLFYVFREALNNIEKHAHASRVRVETNWLPHEMTLTVMDNGQGFDPDQALAAGHYGLKFMRDRIEQLNGCLNIWSKPGEGARLTVSFPYQDEISFTPVSETLHPHEQKVL
jgi:signal transduction histidine kinase